ncbi:MAG: LysR family transcriptional regulator [Pseudomonadota bacterium]
MKVDPRHLEQIAAVVEHGTLQEAAKRLGTSQPALSRMISLVEQRIGSELFKRDSRPLAPTEICKALAKHGRSIATARDRAMEDIRLDRSGIIGELRIGAPPFLCERLVEDAIAAFISERPGIHVKLAAEYFPSLEDRLITNQVDLVICPLRLLAAPKIELNIEKLFEDDHVVVGRKDHPLAKCAEISARDLEAATWISHAEISMLRNDMSTALTSYGVQNLNIAFQSGSAGAIFELLRKSDFLTVMPRYAIRSGPANQDLCALPLKLETTPMTVGVVSPRNNTRSRLQRSFETHLRTLSG